MALQRLTALALAGVLALGATSCGDDPKPSASTPNSTASASPSPSAPSRLAAPVMPDLAKRNDAVGAKAFVRYWFDTVTYAMNTGDTHPMKQASADECKTCAGLRTGIGDIYESGGHTTGASWVPVAFVEDPSAPAPLHRWLVQVKQSRHEITGAEKGNGPVAQKHFSLRISVVWRYGRWLLQEGAEGRK